MFLSPASRARARTLPPVPRSGSVAALRNDIDTSFLRGYLGGGLTLSNDVTSPNTVMAVTAGVCADSTASVMMKLPAFRKSTAGPFVPGSGNNGMGRGLTIAANSTYHQHVIVVNGAVDFYFDTSVTAANAPAGTTFFRRIGSMTTNASAQWTRFIQDGDRFYLMVFANAAAAIAVGTINVTIAVPTGIITTAILNAYYNNATVNSQLGIGPTGLTTPSGVGLIVPVAGTYQAGSNIHVKADTSAQIALTNNTAGGSYNTDTIGWIDTRGAFS